MTHAYLIITHNEFELLKILMKQLDYANNDIYVLIDKKVKNFDKSEITEQIKNANISFVERINIHWAGVSLIDAELILLKNAIQKHHDYYHLISGVDLPIKSQKQIDEFFEKNKGKEFVSFDSKACETNNFLDRVKYYHLQKLRNNIIGKIDNKLVNIQKALNINRIKKLNVSFKKGSNWFDITHEFAEYIVKKMNKGSAWYRIFKHTSFCDEVFIQTLLFSSDFYQNRADYNIRFIDWSKHGGSPEILTENDFDRIVASDRLYARKFSMNKDAEIVKKVIDLIN